MDNGEPSKGDIKEEVRAERTQLLITHSISGPSDQRNRVTRKLLTPIRGNAGSKTTYDNEIKT